MKILTRYALVTSLMLFVALTLFALVSIQGMQRMLLAETVKDAEVLSETLLNSTYHLMLDNDLPRVYQMIQEVATQQDVAHVRLINKDGVVSFSTNPQEIGTLMDKAAEACFACHAQETPLTDLPSTHRSRLFIDAGGAEVLGLAKGIDNQPACYLASCHVHAADSKILGVLDVSLSLDHINIQNTLFRNNFLILATIMLCCLFFAMVILTRIYINEPVLALVQHSRMVSSGNLSARIGSRAGDELGELSRAFDDMTQSLQNAQDELRDWAGNLEARVEERTAEVRAYESKLMHSERLAAIGEMAAGIAHEINNPLTGIMVYAAMTLDHPRLPGELRSDLQVVLGETQRCADIVHRLLEFSRKSKPHMALGDLQEILEGTLALVEHLADFHNIHIERAYEDNLPGILADRDQLRQVFMNIVLNAAQAMAGGGRLTVGCQKSPRAEELQVIIADTGCGIPEEYRSRIFDPFFSTKGAHGTGLGLSVSIGIVQNHGGRIEVASKVGEGSVFTLWFPAA